ncbi:MAG: hypothetical protein PVTTEEND_000846 [Candidatus Fervidibacter sp.]
MKRQRLANSDWQIVGVAISHDRKQRAGQQSTNWQVGKKTAASSEWRVANGSGEQRFTLSSLKVAANGD